MRGAVKPLTVSYDVQYVYDDRYKFEGTLSDGETATMRPSHLPSSLFRTSPSPLGRLLPFIIKLLSSFFKTNNTTKNPTYRISHRGTALQS